MSFTPYLHFQGHCREAMAFYADVFGGTVTVMTYADAPPDSGMPKSDRVMHSDLTLPDGAILMAGDFPEGMDGDAQAAVSVTRTLPDVESARAAFDRLADGGAPIMPFGPTFWSSGFGMVKDRYGTHWIVTVPEAGTA